MTSKLTTRQTEALDTIRAHNGIPYENRTRYKMRLGLSQRTLDALHDKGLVVVQQVFTGGSFPKTRLEYMLKTTTSKPCLCFPCKTARGET